MTNPLADTLDELRAKATPGPWRAGRTATTVTIGAGARRIATMPIRRDTPSYCNAALIIELVNHFPEIIAALRARDGLVEALKRLLKNHGAYIAELPGATGVSDLEFARAALNAARAQNNDGGDHGE